MANDTIAGYKYIQLLAYAVIIGYFIIRLIQKNPIKIIKNKLDIFVILLVFAQLIPVIFNTYISFSACIITILQHIYALGIYILLRECTQDLKGIGGIASNVLIISAIILILMGIDGITSNILKKFLMLLNFEYYTNGENRLISMFGYSNVLAIYIASVLFLNISAFLTTDKKVIKSIYKTITTILLIGIILTYSKGVFLILPISLLVYLFLIKDKKQRVEIISNMIISLIIAIIYVVIFENLERKEYHGLIWLSLGFASAINFGINLLFEKINMKIDLKYLKIILIIVAILSIIYVAIGLNIYDEYAVFTKDSPDNYEARILTNMKGNTEYLFEFNIQAVALKENNDTYSINLIERNIKNKELNTTSLTFDTFTGTKQLLVKSQAETSEIKIEFKSKEKNGDCIIKSLKINDKEVPLEYKILPIKLVNKLKDININYKTAQERVEMIKDAIEISSKNILTGIGADGWKYTYKEVQDYGYSANSVHSYLAKVLIENGILGIIAYAGIMVIVITRINKLKNTQEISLFLAIIILMGHSVIDMNMEYTHILIYNFALLGVLSKTMDSNEKIGNIATNIIFVLIIAISTIIVIQPKIYDKTLELQKLVEQQSTLKKDSDEYKNINYQLGQQAEKILEYERYSYLDNYYNIINYYINSNSTEIDNILEAYYNKVANYENKSKNNRESIMKKTHVVNNIISRIRDQRSSKYNEILCKFMDIVINEYNKTKKELTEFLAKEYITDDRSVKNLDYMYNKILELRKNYFCGVLAYRDSNIVIDEQEIASLKLETRPSVLIYHTHGTESYRAEAEYEMYEFYRSIDANYNVIRVGEYLKELLEQKGIDVVHNKEYNDLPSVTGAYTRSRQIVENELANNRNIDVIIDLHRDAYSEQEYIAETADINGEKVAPLRFVIGINKNDPQWKYDLKLAIELQKQADKLYPGLFKSMLIRNKDYYNQDLSKHAILIEVGENNNLVEEALNSMKYFSELLNSGFRNEEMKKQFIRTKMPSKYVDKKSKICLTGP